MAFDARDRAMRMLAEDPRREIYEGAAPGGKKGCGLFYVTYSEGRSPTLTWGDIERLLKDGLIGKKYSGCYVATSPSPSPLNSKNG